MLSLMADFVQTLITTIEVGSLYALIALGYTMVYGILKFINFAHSDIVVLGAWTSYTLATNILPRLGLDPHNPEVPPPLWVGGIILIAAMAFCGLAGFLIERLAYKPLRRAPRLLLPRSCDSCSSPFGSVACAYSAVRTREPPETNL